jgi:hypothetical protein
MGFRVCQDGLENQCGWTRKPVWMRHCQLGYTLRQDGLENQCGWTGHWFSYLRQNYQSL